MAHFYTNKKNLTTKRKLYTTCGYMSTDTSFENKMKKKLTTKMKLYTTSEFISSDISFEKKKKSHYKNKTLHN